jgi:hypothetical protein
VRLGAKIGEAYQVADDIQDATATPEELGKPCGVDAALERPSAVAELGLDGATREAPVALVEEGRGGAPCPGRDEMQEWCASRPSVSYPGLRCRWRPDWQPRVRLPGSRLAGLLPALRERFLSLA